MRLASSRCSSAVVAAATGRRRLRPSSCLMLQYLSTTSDKKAPDEDEDDEMLEWIPPNRPLGGDKGKSHLYPRETAAQKRRSKDVTKANDDDEDVVNLKLSDIDLDAIDFGELDVEPGAASGVSVRRT